MDEALRLAASMPREGVLIVMLAGALHNAVGFLRHDRPYDFFTPKDESKQIEEGVTIIPAHALADMFFNLSRRNPPLDEIRAAASCPVCHLATPPPKEDAEFLTRRVARYRERVVDDLSISPAALRLRLWQLEMQVLRQLCTEWRIGFVPAPPEATCRDGFLKREYYGEDAWHANAAYGELVLRQLERLELRPIMGAAG
jgi:hypothetical protein